MKNEVAECFWKRYGKSSEFLVQAPGRINLIGEHTDYNGGLILPAAIDKYMYFAFGQNEDRQIRIYAKDLDQSVTIQLDDLHKTNMVWVNYFMGLLIEFRKKGIKLTGFDCVFSSDIPMGGGMSSSAALECGFALGVDYLSNAKLDYWTLIDMSHYSNHNFMNIYGGIMDQFSSLFGKKDNCMLMDCSNRSFEYYPLNLEKSSIVVINSKVKHEHSSSGYNDRAEECKEIERRLYDIDSRVKKMSDANITEVNEAISTWPKHLRSRFDFVLSENNRVRNFVKAMEANDMETCGSLLYHSHQGLQYDFEVSCPEMDILVNLAKNKKAIFGARMMGGGFGGCTINFILSEQVESVVCEILDEYTDATGIQAEAYDVQISDGAKVLH